MFRSKPQKLGETLARLWQESPEMHEHLLEIKGEECLKRYFSSMQGQIREVKISEGVVYITTLSPAMKHYIRLHAQEILDAVNEHLGVYLVRTVKYR